jgi:hypothetical protein
MKINQLSYYDHKRQWRLEPIEFSDFNLLVGVSGVGKTRILQAILDLQKISEGKSLNGVEWDIHFTYKNNEYHWSGEFECNISNNLILENEENNFSNNSNFKIKNESLSKNGELIIDRNEIEIKFKNNILPIKPSPVQSVVETLNGEADIAAVKHGFESIISTVQWSDASLYNGLIYNIVIDKIFKDSSLDQRMVVDKRYYQSNLPVQIKLVIAYFEKNPIFQAIKERFINIFEQVEDIKIEQDEDENEEDTLLNSIQEKAPLTIKIKEKGVNNWIS